MCCEFRLFYSFVFGPLLLFKTVSRLRLFCYFNCIPFILSFKGNGICFSFWENSFVLLHIMHCIWIYIMHRKRGRQKRF